MSTKYVILKREDDPDTGDATDYWSALERVVEARNAHEAVRAIGAQGVFVAVPARSWVPLKLETVTRTTVSEA